MQSPTLVRVVNSGAIGNSWFVNGTTGSDDNNGTAAAPFATLAAAQAAAVANNGDVVYLVGRVAITSTLVWAKDGVSLVGLASPSGNCRSRIVGSGSVFTPLVNVTAQGCSFVNIGTFHGFASATAQVCWAEAGGRNFYSSCQLFGGGDATAAAQAGMRSLTIAGSGENRFVGCTIGLDTILRATAANASLEFLAGTARNEFRECIFRMYTSLATNVHVKALAAAADRDQLFERCAFFNAIDSTGIAINAAFSINAAAGGSFMLHHPMSIGATKLSAAGPVYIIDPIPATATGGLAVAAS